MRNTTTDSSLTIQEVAMLQPRSDAMREAKRYHEGLMMAHMGGPGSSLLSFDSDAKTRLSNRRGDFKVRSVICYLAPAENTIPILQEMGELWRLQGRTRVNLCAEASPGCIAACLFRSGRGGMSNVAAARARRSAFFMSNRAEFLWALAFEIRRQQLSAKRARRRLAVRLNGTSDWTVETVGAEILAAFPTVRFYDYTAAPHRIAAVAGIPNYDLTYSRKETAASDAAAVAILAAGGNVAVPFVGEFDGGAEMPREWRGFEVIDGTVHDLRIPEVDGRGVVVGLCAKGSAAKRDTSGFMVTEADETVRSLEWAA